MTASEPRSWRDVPRSVRMLGFVAMLTDLSAEMIHRMLPLLLLLEVTLVTGGALLAASTLAGYAWEQYGSSATILFRAGFAGLAAAGMLLRGPARTEEVQPAETEAPHNEPRTGRRRTSDDAWWAARIQRGGSVSSKAIEHAYSYGIDSSSGSGLQCSSALPFDT